MPDLKWQTEIVRLTAFPVTPVSPDSASDWWRTVAGVEPETTATLARKTARRDEGPLLGGQLVLGLEPGRIDWVLTPNPIQEAEFLNVGPFPEAADAVVRLLLEKWQPIMPPVARLAVGVVLTIQVGDRAEGYRLLQGFLPSVKLDPDRSSDFLYQINRPARSAATGVILNRLGKWSVAKIQRIQIPASPGVQTGALVGVQLHACRLELDVNTDAENRDALGNTAAILQELLTESETLATRGDVS